ncbi:MAG TPA: hypothetical protein VGG86_06915 [Roseiarcus sp.]|jgi:hypothetical protein
MPLNDILVSLAGATMEQTAIGVLAVAAAAVIAAAIGPGSALALSSNGTATTADLSPLPSECDAGQERASMVIDSKPLSKGDGDA